MARRREPSESARLYEELIESPFVVDVALHENGVFDEFLAARNALLPDDEALLAAQWTLVDRGVFEIQRIDGDRLDLHDIGRGEQITVVNTHPSSRTRVGTLLLGRPLPVGDTHRAFGGFIEIPRAAVADLLDLIGSGDAAAITAFLGELFRPPRAQNTDGHDLELHTIRWTIPAREIDPALRGAGLQRHEGETVWRMTRTAPGAPATVIATVERSGNELVGEVNSRQRADTLRATIAAAIPDSVFISDTVTSIDDAIANHQPAEASAQTSRNDPEARAVMAAFMADYVRRWLDEQIPALGGRTPRDAVTDPIGREQLSQLLDSFPVPDDSDVGAMNPQRLRSALGL